HILFFFFFSSRRRHTRFSRDWSSDVCSSDLEWVELWNGSAQDVDLSTYFLGTTYSSNTVNYVAATPLLSGTLKAGACKVIGGPRSEERRVGKEWRSGWGRGKRK